jgi:peptide/nickel transport system ATP-binding protein
VSEPALLLSIEGLRIALASGAAVVDDVSLEIERGQILGIVGESGSGKTTLGVSALGYVRPGARFERGAVTVDGEQVAGRSPKELARLRRRLVSYVPQDPAASLNPSIRIEEHIRDRVRSWPAGEQHDLIDDALRLAQLPIEDAFKRRYPHELSGGQQQRVLLAMAIAGRPELIVLDEPTTGLDVVVQSLILKEVTRLRDELGVTFIFVSHDIAAVGSVADRIAVMYAGRIVEQGATEQILKDPKHPYTADLLACVPHHARPTLPRGIPGTALGVGEWPPGCPYAARCRHRVAACEEAMPPPEHVGAPDHEVWCIRWREIPPGSPHSAPEGARADRAAETVLDVRKLTAGHRAPAGRVVAAREISFSISSGECVALVGQSGSGKTTIARCVAGLHAPDGGEIRLHGTPLASSAAERPREARRRVQMVFQNPYESLNPRHTVRAAIERPARVLRGLSVQEAATEASHALDQVGLSARLAHRYPRDLSGGERQRVAIARALTVNPELLICDEITSALDVSVQATVLEVLDQLRSTLGLAILFITHDLGVVASVADRVLVLNRGHVCETGIARDVLMNPTDEYTRLLVSSAPAL